MRLLTAVWFTVCLALLHFPTPRPSIFVIYLVSIGRSSRQEDPHGSELRLWASTQRMVPMCSFPWLHDGERDRRSH